jgi:hypothetical protein
MKKNHVIFPTIILLSVSKIIYLITGLCILFQGCASHDPSIRITEINSQYNLTVPECQVNLKFPKGNFIRHDAKLLVESTDIGGLGNPRYFFFSNDKSDIIISGWFESKKQYPLWEEYKKNFAKAASKVSFVKEGIWDTVILSDEGRQHMRASCLLADTWIDLHISTNAVNGDSNERLITFLKTIQVEIKPKANIR